MLARAAVIARRAWPSPFAVLAVTISLASPAHAQPGPDDGRAPRLPATPAQSDAEPASAPDPGRLLSLEPSFAVMAPAGAALMLGVATTWRRADSELWYRAALSAGHPAPDVEGGALEARAGIEYRRASCPGGCLYAGIDLAYVDFDVKDDPEEYSERGLVAIARGGVDVGGDTVRFRLGLELAMGATRYRDREPDLTMPLDSTTTRFTGGFALTSAVALRF
jgi:hypothetical protein